jgi:hypothetical protein
MQSWNEVRARQERRKDALWLAEEDQLVILTPKGGSG